MSKLEAVKRIVAAAIAAGDLGPAPRRTDLTAERWFPPSR